MPTPAGLTSPGLSPVESPQVSPDLAQKLGLSRGFPLPAHLSRDATRSKDFATTSFQWVPPSLKNANDSPDNHFNRHKKLALVHNKPTTVQQEDLEDEVSSVGVQKNFYDTSGAAFADSDDSNYGSQVNKYCTKPGSPVVKFSDLFPPKDKVSEEFAEGSVSKSKKRQSPSQSLSPAEQGRSGLQKSFPVKEETPQPKRRKVKRRRKASPAKCPAAEKTSAPQKNSPEAPFLYAESRTLEVPLQPLEVKKSEPPPTKQEDPLAGLSSLLPSSVGHGLEEPPIAAFFSQVRNELRSGGPRPALPDFPLPDAKKPEAGELLVSSTGTTEERSQRILDAIMGEIRTPSPDKAPLVARSRKALAKPEVDLVVDSLLEKGAKKPITISTNLPSTNLPRATTQHQPLQERKGSKTALVLRSPEDILVSSKRSRSKKKTNGRSPDSKLSVSTAPLASAPWTLSSPRMLENVCCLPSRSPSSPKQPRSPSSPKQLESPPRSHGANRSKLATAKYIDEDVSPVLVVSAAQHPDTRSSPILLKNPVNITEESLLVPSKSTVHSEIPHEGRTGSATLSMVERGGLTETQEKSFEDVQHRGMFPPLSDVEERVPLEHEEFRSAAALGAIERGPTRSVFDRNAESPDRMACKPSLTRPERPRELLHPKAPVVSTKAKISGILKRMVKNISPTKSRSAEVVQGPRQRDLEGLRGPITQERAASPERKRLSAGSVAIRNLWRDTLASASEMKNPVKGLIIRRSGPSTSKLQKSNFGDELEENFQGSVAEGDMCGHLNRFVGSPGLKKTSAGRESAAIETLKVPTANEEHAACCEGFGIAESALSSIKMHFGEIALASGAKLISEDSFLTSEKKSEKQAAKENNASNRLEAVVHERDAAMDGLEAPPQQKDFRLKKSPPSKGKVFPETLSEQEEDSFEIRTKKQERAWAADVTTEVNKGESSPFLAADLSPGPKHLDVAMRALRLSDEVKTEIALAHAPKSGSKIVPPPEQQFFDATVHNKIKNEGPNALLEEQKEFLLQEKNMASESSQRVGSIVRNLRTNREDIDLTTTSVESRHRIPNNAARIGSLKDLFLSESAQEESKKRPKSEPREARPLRECDARVEVKAGPGPQTAVYLSSIRSAERPNTLGEAGKIRSLSTSCLSASMKDLRRLEEERREERRAANPPNKQQRAADSVQLQPIEKPTTPANEAGSMSFQAYQDSLLMRSIGSEMSPLKARLPDTSGCITSLRDTHKLIERPSERQQFVVTSEAMRIEEPSLEHPVGLLSEKRGYEKPKLFASSARDSSSIRSSYGVPVVENSADKNGFMFFRETPHASKNIDPARAEHESRVHELLLKTGWISPDKKPEKPTNRGVSGGNVDRQRAFASGLTTSVTSSHDNGRNYYFPESGGAKRLLDLPAPKSNFYEQPGCDFENVVAPRTRSPDEIRLTPRGPSPPRRLNDLQERLGSLLKHVNSALKSNNWDAISTEKLLLEEASVNKPKTSAKEVAPPPHEPSSPPRVRVRAAELLKEAPKESLRLVPKLANLESVTDSDRPEVGATLAQPITTQATPPSPNQALRKLRANIHSACLLQKKTSPKKKDLFEAETGNRDSLNTELQSKSNEVDKFQMPVAMSIVSGADERLRRMQERIHLGAPDKETTSYSLRDTHVQATMALAAKALERVKAPDQVDLGSDKNCLQFEPASPPEPSGSPQVSTGGKWVPVTFLKSAEKILKAAQHPGKTVTENKPEQVKENKENTEPGSAAKEVAAPLSEGKRERHRIRPPPTHASEHEQLAQPEFRPPNFAPGPNRGALTSIPQLPWGRGLAGGHLSLLGPRVLLPFQNSAKKPSLKLPSQQQQTFVFHAAPSPPPITAAALQYLEQSARGELFSPENTFLRALHPEGLPLPKQREDVPAVRIPSEYLSPMKMAKFPPQLGSPPKLPPSSQEKVFLRVAVAGTGCSEEPHLTLQAKLRMLEEMQRP